jgi:predicted NBD/HSP70 family sugar kinase
LNKQAAYKRTLITQLYFGGDLSCAELSNLTAKSVPLTTRLLAEMIKDGSVVEKGYAHSTGGRRPQMYSLQPQLLYIVCVAMDQLITKIALMDGRNKLVGNITEVELGLAGNDNALNELNDAIATFIATCGIPKKKIAGIGIGMPGFVDVLKGNNYSFLQSESGSIVSTLQDRIGLPVFIDNDSSLIALAEQRLGAAKGRQNVMVINISWGVGLGMILKGELFRGHNGFAGEFSHIPIFANNKMCSCGKTGCLETETSLLYIAEKALESVRSGRISILKDISLEHKEEMASAIMEAAQKGDKLAVDLFSEAGYKIGKGVAILIHLINPELIVLSGRGAAAGRVWLAPIQQAINEHCIPKIAENTEIVLSSLSYEAELFGAAALVMEHYENINPAGHKRSSRLQEDTFSQ